MPRRPCSVLLTKPELHQSKNRSGLHSEYQLQMDTTPSTYKGPIGPLRHRCAHCKASKPKLKRCLGCLAVKYCNAKHQTDDWPLHQSVCAKIKHARARLEEEEYRVRNAPQDFMTPANAFETDVGRFWGLLHTRDYMRARFALAGELLLNLGTLSSVTEALKHMRDMLRLCRGDNMGLRGLIPAVMLRLDRDQECYDFVKWWSTCDGFEWDNMDAPYLDTRNADVFEDPGFLITRFPALNNVVAILLLKLKLLVDIRNIRVARKILAQRSVPLDICRLIEPNLVRSPLSKGFLKESPEGLDQLELRLLKHSRELGTALTNANQHFIYNLFEPDEALSGIPEAYSPGSWEEMALAMRYCYAAFWETAGVLPLLRDARLCATRNLKGDVEETMRGEALRSGKKSCHTAEEKLQVVSAKRIWEHLGDAVKNATDLGP